MSHMPFISPYHAVARAGSQTQLKHVQITEVPPPAHVKHFILADSFSSRTKSTEARSSLSVMFLPTTKIQNRTSEPVG